LVEKNLNADEEEVKHEEKVVGSEERPERRG
jgi:hypothetical protein